MRIITTLIGIFVLALFLGVVFRIMGWLALLIAGISISLIVSIPGLIILTIAVTLLFAGGGILAALLVAIVGGILLAVSIPFSAPFLLGILVAVIILRARDNRLLRNSR